MKPLHHILSCSLVTWWQTVIRLSLTHQPVTFPSLLLANLRSRRLPSWHLPPASITPIALTIVSFPPTPSLLSPPLPFPSIHLSSLPFLSFSSPFVLLTTPCLLTSCLPTTCHLSSSQPPHRLRWALPSISLVVFPHFIIYCPPPHQNHWHHPPAHFPVTASALAILVLIPESRHRLLVMAKVCETVNNLQSTSPSRLKYHRTYKPSVLGILPMDGSSWS